MHDGKAVILDYRGPVSRGRLSRLAVACAICSLLSCPCLTSALVFPKNASGPMRLTYDQRTSMRGLLAYGLPLTVCAASLVARQRVRWSGGRLRGAALATWAAGVSLFWFIGAFVILNASFNLVPGTG